MPNATNVNAKIIWLIVGSRDLSVQQCSEDVIALGIQRIAQELQHYNPQATIVLQSILPRTLHADGSLESPMTRPLKHHSLLLPHETHVNQKKTKKKKPRSNNLPQHTQMATEYNALDQDLEAMEEEEERQLHHAEPHHDTYLWPSIHRTNLLLQEFCNSHDDKMEFFDATPLFLTSRGNDRHHNYIRHELLRDYAQLSHQGHAILLQAIQERISQILAS